MLCPCQSEKSFSDCCEPLLAGHAFAPTAEALMRSRYTAFTTADVPYLHRTLAPESRRDFDSVQTEKWARQAEWKGLKILSTKKGLASDKSGTVEFVATYEIDGQRLEHHEVSQFRKTEQGRWYFVSGEAHTHKDGEGHEPSQPQTVVRETPKIGRNDPCPCGSGKKHKKCCAA